MERSILKTLIYGDIFDYPLTLREIHKWLIKEKINLRVVEGAVNRLIKKGKVGKYGDYYFLKGRKNIVKRRAKRAKHSAIYIRKANIISQLLKAVPWIKLVGISGGLAMENASKKDDIDLILITAKNRMWISRFLTLGVLGLIGQRRKVGDNKLSAVGKICCNILLEENKLEQRNDLYTAHEVLQMKVLWQRNGVYSKFLSDNEWVFKFLPNWISSTSLRARRSNLFRSNMTSDLKVTDWIENLAKRIQLKIMKKPKGQERIEDGALYFHPINYRDKVLTLYRQRTRFIGNA